MAQVPVLAPDEDETQDNRRPRLWNPDKSLTPAGHKAAKVILVALFVVLVFTLFGVLSSRNHLQKQVDQLSKSSTASNDITAYTNEISKTFKLPEGEKPTLLTVSDAAAAKAKNPGFFKDAANGDKVLLYAKAGEAILYRPSANKIIAVANINLSNSGASSTTTSR